MKAHIFRTDSPLKHGTTVSADCGTAVPNVLAVFWTEGYVDDMGVSAVLFCKDCAQRAQQASDKKYFYGVVNGQEALDQGEAE